MPVELPFPLDSPDEICNDSLYCLMEKRSGVLYLTTERVVFWPDSDTRVARGDGQVTTAKKDVRMKLSRITQCEYLPASSENILAKISTLDKAYIFQFTDAATRTQLKTVLDKFIDLGMLPELTRPSASDARAAGAAAAAAAAVEGPSPAKRRRTSNGGVPHADTDRHRYLKEHPKVQLQYSRLVPELLTDEQFWADRAIAAELAVQKAQQTQSTEQESSVDRYVAVNDSGKTEKFEPSMDREMIEHILQTEPAVNEAHQAMVEGKQSSNTMAFAGLEGTVSQVEFWGSYFTYKHRHQEVTTDLRYPQLHAAVRSETKRKLQNDTDLSAEQQQLPLGYGTAGENAGAIFQRAASGESRARLLELLNMQAANFLINKKELHTSKSSGNSEKQKKNVNTAMQLEVQASNYCLAKLKVPVAMKAPVSPVAAYESWQAEINELGTVNHIFDCLNHFATCSVSTHTNLSCANGLTHAFRACGTASIASGTSIPQRLLARFKATAPQLGESGGRGFPGNINESDHQQNSFADVAAKEYENMLRTAYEQANVCLRLFWTAAKVR
eukprot:SAG31_NODE_2441_length_5684_cov_6.528021_1_plen_557_part_00